MACRIIRNEDKSVNYVLAENNEQSQLYQNLVSSGTGQEVALKSWAATMTPTFKAWGGENLLLDVNNEPRVLFQNSFEFHRKGVNPPLGQGTYFATSLEKAKELQEKFGGDITPKFVKSTPTFFPNTSAAQSYVKSNPNTDLITPDLLVLRKEPGLDVKNAILEKGYMGATEKLPTTAEEIYNEREAFEDRTNRLKDENIIGVANVLSDKFSVSYDIVNAEEAEALTRGAKNPWSGQSGFFYQGKVYLVRDKFNVNTVIHEFAHPFVRAIIKNNPDLANKLLDEVLENPKYQAKLEENIEIYGEDNDLAVEETLVEALEDEVLRDMEDSNIIRKFIAYLKKIFRSILGAKTNVESLSMTTSLVDLAKIFNSSEQVYIPEATIMETDFAAYKKNQKKAEQEIIETLKNLQVPELNKVLRDKIDTNQKFLKNIRAVVSELEKNDPNTRYLKHLMVDKAGNIKSVEKLLKDVSSGSNNQDQILDKFLDLENDAKDAESFLTSYRNLTKEILNSVALMKYEFQQIKQDAALEKNLDAFSKFYKVLQDFEDFTEFSKNFFSNIDNVDNDIMVTLSTIRNEIDTMTGDRKLNILKAPLFRRMEENMQDYNDVIRKEYDRKVKSAKGNQKKLQEAEQWLTENLATAENMGNILENKTDRLRFLLASQKMVSDPIAGSLIKEIGDAKKSIRAAKREQTYRHTETELINGTTIAQHANKVTNKNKNFQAYEDDGYLSTETRYQLNSNTGKLEPVQRLVIRNEYKDYVGVLERYGVGLDELRKKHEANPENLEIKERYSQKVKEWREFNANNFHREFKDEVYGAGDKIYDANGELGEKARELKAEALRNLFELQTSINNAITNVDNNTGGQDIKELEDEYRLAKSEYDNLYQEFDSEGNQKTGDELEVIRILKEVREATKKYYTFTEVPGMFREAYLKEHERIENDLGFEMGSDEYKTQMDKWLEYNAVERYTQDYYDELADIRAEIDYIKETSDLSEEAEILTQELSDAYRKLYNVSYGYRDHYGQYDGTQMSLEQRSKIREVEKEIESLKEALKEENKKNKNSGLIDLFARLRDLQTEEYTDYFYEMIRDFLEKAVPIEILKEEISKETDVEFAKKMGLEHEAIDWTTVNDIPKWVLEEFYFTPSKYDKVKEALENSPYFDEFKEQRKVNLFRKNDKSLEAIKAFRVKKPNNEKDYMSTEITDRDGNLLTTLRLVPGSKYFTQTVKKEYHTGYNPKTKEIDTTEFKDSMGNWLPDTNKSDIFVDKEFMSWKAAYDRVKAGKGSSTDMDLAVKYDFNKNMLEMQSRHESSMNPHKRLGAELGRYRKNTMERSKAFIGNTKEGVKGAVAAGKGFIDEYLNQSDDSFEQGLNYSDEEQASDDVIGNRKFRSENAIPITGNYRIDINDTSRDMLGSVLMRSNSALEHKELSKLEPTYKLMVEMMEQYEESAKKKLGTQKSMTKVDRVDTIKKILDKQLYGQNYAGAGKDSQKLNKFIQASSAVSSFAAFAWNTPSAIKNYGGAMTQWLLEAALGDVVTFKSLAQGKRKGFQLMRNYMMQYRKKGLKNLDAQILEIFEVDEGTFDNDFIRNMSKGYMDDAMNIHVPFREWSQRELTFSVFASMMYAKKIKTLDGKKINYFQAWELNDEGFITLKDNIDPKYGIDGKEFKDTIDLFHSKNREIQGNYARESQAEMQRWALARAFLFFQKYFVTMFLRRYGGKLNNGNVEGIYNPMTNRLELGVYAQTLANLQRAIKNRDAKEIFNRQLLGLSAFLALDLGMGWLLMQMMTWFFGYDPDDSERFAKLRAEGGTPDIFPYSLINSEKFKDKYDYDTKGWMAAMTLNALFDTRTEAESFNLFSTAGRNNIYQTVTLSEGTMLTKGSVGVLFNMFNTWVDSEYYQKDMSSGVYFKEPGQAKWKKYGYRLIGVSGNIVDPYTALKTKESFSKK